MTGRTLRIGAALALLAGPLVARDASALDKVTLNVGWLVQGENAYTIAGRDKGFYQEEGIDLEVVRGFGAGDTIKKVVTGAATVGIGDVGTMMLSRVRENVPVKCIFNEYTYLPLGMFVLASSGITSIKDLAGKRLGASPGTSIILYWPLVAKANGIDPASLTLTTLEGSALIPTLLAGKVDVIPGFVTVFGLRNDEATAQGKPMRLLSLPDFGLKVMGQCQMVSEATIREKPDLLARYVRATLKSVRWSREHPEEVARSLSAAYPELKEEPVLKNHKAYMGFVFNEMSDRVGVGGFDMDQMARTFDALKQAQNVTASPSMAGFVDAQFLPKR